MTLFEPVLSALDQAGVRFVVVGGVAVVLQGHPRLTVDLDLAIDLTADSPSRAMAALSAIGLVPLLPVEAKDFASDEIRASWVRDRNLKVFSLRDPADPLLQVDIFAEDPIPFDDLWNDAQVVELDDLAVRVASIPHLTEMKQAAGRPQDLADIAALEAIQREAGRR